MALMMTETLMLKIGFTVRVIQLIKEKHKYLMDNYL